MDRVSQQRLDELAPKVRRLGGQLLAQLETEGYIFRITQGLRSWNNQQELWLKGRDADGNIIDIKQVVTHAPPGYSYHQFGMAIDGVPMNGIFPDWSEPEDKEGVVDLRWARWQTISEELGFVSGSRWSTEERDWPHVQITGRFGVSPEDEVRQLFLSGGMRAIWEEAGLIE